MSDYIIDEKVKTYLIACLVTGIDVACRPDVFMDGLVHHMNSIERPYWTEGDEDGVIIHNKHDQPLLYVMYNGKRMTFRAFDEDEFSAFDSKKEIGYSLLNIIDYIRSLELEMNPSVLGSESNMVAMETSDDTSDTNPEDWLM